MKSILSLLFLGSSALAHSLTLYATHYSGTVNKIEFHPHKRHFAITQTLKACGKSPSWLTLDKESNTLYCLDESGDASTGTPGTLTAFDIAPNGDLVEKVKVNTMPGGVHSTVYGKDNKKYLAIANYGSSAIQTFALPLQNQSQPTQTITLDKGSKPHAVYVDPLTKSSLIVPDLGSDTIRVYGICDKNPGLLIECPQKQRTWQGRGPRHAAFTRDASNNTMMYVANENSNTILTFRLHNDGKTKVSGDTGDKQTRSSIVRRYARKTITEDLTCPSLEFVTEFENILGEDPVPKKGAYLGEIRAANNRDLYVSLRGTKSVSGHDSFIQLCTASTEDTLKPIRHVRHTDSYGEFPRTFEISPDGHYVAIGNQYSSNVAIVRRDPFTGRLHRLVASIPVGETGDPKQDGGLSSVVWGKKH